MVAFDAQRPSPAVHYASQTPGRQILKELDVLEDFSGGLVIASPRVEGVGALRAGVALSHQSENSQRGGKDKGKNRTKGFVSHAFSPY
jgi:hypothetical protein